MAKKKCGHHVERQFIMIEGSLICYQGWKFIYYMELYIYYKV